MAIEPVVAQKNGWTVFRYAISRQGIGIMQSNGKHYPLGDVVDRLAVTTYCGEGRSTKVSLPILERATVEEKQQLNQLNRSLSLAVGKVGWLTIVDGEALFVHADSDASLEILETACIAAQEQELRLQRQ